MLGFVHNGQKGWPCQRDCSIDKKVLRLSSDVIHDLPFYFQRLIIKDDPGAYRELFI